MNLPDLSKEQSLRLVGIADRLLVVLKGWRSEGIDRSSALCACVVLVGLQGGLEGAHGKEQFVAFIQKLLEWSFDLGERERRELQQ